MYAFSRIRRALMASAFVLPMMACAPNPPVLLTSEPTSVETTTTYKNLRSLPAPKRPVPVAVYSYPDLTGQFKPSDSVSTNSRAVTQGAVWMLVKALKDASGGQWFKVIQRANLENLLKERQIIRETRGRIERTSGKAQPGLPSLLFAGVILEGGIIGYDSNTVSGGLGARYLGIGGDVQYRQDTVTVYLNAISSQTGEVMKSVMTRKTVASYGVRGSVFKFVAFQKLLEGETGYTVNEPGQIALAQAIEHAVRALIIEGALEGLWQFEDELAGKAETQAYLADKEEHLLIGDSTSEAALALLTDEQLRALNQRRQERRRPTQMDVVQASRKEAPAANPLPAKQGLVSPRGEGGDGASRGSTSQKLADSLRKVDVTEFPMRRHILAQQLPTIGDAKTIDPPNAEEIAAQQRLAQAFSARMANALILDFDAERLSDSPAEQPKSFRIAKADVVR